MTGDFSVTLRFTLPTVPLLTIEDRDDPTGGSVLIDEFGELVEVVQHNGTIKPQVYIMSTPPDPIDKSILRCRLSHVMTTTTIKYLVCVTVKVSDLELDDDSISFGVNLTPTLDPSVEGKMEILDIQTEQPGEVDWLNDEDNE